MKQTRHSVFETNSSSTHSLSVVKGAGTYDTLPLFSGNDDQEYVSVDQGEFGWGYEEITNPEGKAAYLWTYVLSKGADQRLKDMLERAILKHTGADYVEFEYGDEGYIDHQSSENAEPIFESEDRIIDFIFNPRSVLILDTDNR